jgi:hypothetical protein
LRSSPRCARDTASIRETPASRVVRYKARLGSREFHTQYFSRQRSWVCGFPNKIARGALHQRAKRFLPLLPLTSPKRKARARGARTCTLSRPSQFVIDGALHCASAGSVCEVLAGLERCSENVRRLHVIQAQQSTTNRSQTTSRPLRSTIELRS